MGASLWQCSSAAKAVFAKADIATGLPLTRVCFEGPADRLTDTAYAQPGVVAASLAAAEALRERLSEAGKEVEPSMCAGHSVGELAALAQAGALSLEDCFKLVAARGKLMAEASSLADGTMVAVMGLDEAELARLCETASKETDASVQVANLNAPGQIVISGNREAIERASVLARASGARRVIELDVSGPFHSIYMQPAADGFKTIVDDTLVLSPSVPVVLNVNALPSREPAEIKQELVRQVTGSVRWVDSVKTMLEFGCTIFVELGPGQVLSGLVKRINRDAVILNVEDEQSLERTTENLLQLV